MNKSKLVSILGIPILATAILFSGCGALQLLDKDYRARVARLIELNQQFNKGVEGYYEPSMRERCKEPAQRQDYEN